MPTDEPSPRESGPIVIDGISYIPSSALQAGIPKISFKDDRAFGVVNTLGEAPRVYHGGSELGFYFNDTRYLGTWEMTFNGVAPVALANELRYGGTTIVLSMTNPDFKKVDGEGRIPRDTFLIRRILTLHNDTLFETVEIKNFDSVSHSLQIEHWVGGGFHDVFEVRGFPRAQRGRMLPSEERKSKDETISVLQYEGLDGRLRRTFVRRYFQADRLNDSPSLLGYLTKIVVPPKEKVSLRTIVSFDELTDGRLHGQPYKLMSVADKMQLVLGATQDEIFAPVHFNSDNNIFNRAIQNAQTDIYMLLTQETFKSETLVYPYAGIPWFSAPFGRDGMITAYQLLPWFPGIARGVLDYALNCLGSERVAYTDEQPGKVFHEMRRGEMTNTREVPFYPYYGSIDSTPLALILLHEYTRWSMDRDFLQAKWPLALEALRWIDRWGDSDGDGFVEYMQESSNGLINQGWKDSHDSIMHADGRLAAAPIRLCEVQGYVFRAKMGMSALALWIGDRELGARLRREALELKARFTEKYWDSQGQYIYLALDAQSEPCAVRSSNMGHCLWSQIVTTEQSSGMVASLMSDAMFSGYGIRTLASTEVAYNPMSYHNGSVWPHDNSLILEGFRYYNYTAELEKLSGAMMGVIESSQDFRLPELFCGIRKRGAEPPIPYVVACKPQAWAAGSIFLMLKAMLGLSTDVDQSYVVFNSPVLTEKMNTLEIKNLAGRDWEMDLRFRRSKTETYVDVIRKKGNPRVLTVK